MPTYNFDNPDTSSSTPTTKYNFDTGISPQPSNKGGWAGPQYLTGNAASSPLGVAYNTVVGLPQAAGTVIKDIGQGLAKDFFGVGMSLANVINKIRGADISTSYTPTNAFSKAVLGDEPVNDIATRVANAEQAIKDNPIAKKFGLDKHAGPLAFGGVIGSVALDFTPMGGDEAVAKQLLKETSDKGVFNILTKAKVPEAVAKVWAPHFADATTPKEVSTLMELMKSATGAHNISEALPNLTEKAVTEAPLQPQQPTQNILSSLENPQTGPRSSILENVSSRANPVEAPAVNQLPKEVAPQTEKLVESLPDPTLNNEYVKDTPFKTFVGQNDKTTAQGLRDEFVGLKNEQIVRGNQLADEIKRLVPDKAEREGMFWYKAANGDKTILEDALRNSDLADYHSQIEAALNLSPQAIENLSKISKYYDEAAQVSMKNGTIKGVTENYQNRLYEPTPPKDFVKSELNQNLKQTTSHAKARIFNTEFEAAEAGKKFATTDVADALSVYNEEIARANTSRKLADAMHESGIGAWSDKNTPGWTQVGNLKKDSPPIRLKDGSVMVRHLNFVAPDGIAKGLRAISDSNFLTKIDVLRGIQKYQGLVKTVDLAFSFFHHLTFAVQTLSQGGITALVKSPVMGKILASPEFAKIEQDFLRHTGITTKVSTNQDIIKSLIGKGKGLYDKLTRAPVIKQTLGASEKMSEFLFDKIQRYLKVSDYGNKISGWVASHPTATNDAVIAAKKGFAKEINAAYGGLNWESIGRTKSEVAALRYILLAPDFTISNASMVKYAFQTGTAGSSARKNLVIGTASMMALTEGLNKIITGHFTDKNPTGHKMEIEVAPGVYISLLRGAQGEVNKLISNIIVNGPLKGTAQYAQGKLSPFVRTGVGLASGVNYYGQQIAKKGEGPIKSTIDYAKYIAANAGPVPFGASNTGAYIAGKNPTPVGVATMATGVGRFAPSSVKKSVKYKF